MEIASLSYSLMSIALSTLLMVVEADVRRLLEAAPATLLLVVRNGVVRPTDSDQALRQKIGVQPQNDLISNPQGSRKNWMLLQQRYGLRAFDSI